MQAVDIADDAGHRVDTAAERFEVTREVIVESPFVLIGSIEQIVDKLQRLRDGVGISHYVVRDAEGFAPIVSKLAGR